MTSNLNANLTSKELSDAKKSLDYFFDFRNYQERRTLE